MPAFLYRLALIAGSGLALVVSLPASGNAQGVASADRPPLASLSVTGDGSVPVTPDIAEVDGGVATEAKTAREATELNNTAMTEVMKALKNAGVNEKDIRTTRLSLSPQYPPNRSLPTQIVGYRATNHVRVKLRELAKAPIVLDTMIAAGANEIGGISFFVSDPSKPLDKARIEAMADARRKAEIYARAAGVSLGTPLQIVEEGASAPSAFRQGVAMRAAAPMATPVEPGEQTLRVSVSVTYQIKVP